MRATQGRARQPDHALGQTAARGGAQSTALPHHADTTQTWNLAHNLEVISKQRNAHPIPRARLTAYRSWETTSIIIWRLLWK